MTWTMPIPHSHRRSLLGIGLLALIFFPALANAAAGHFLFVHGRVSVTAGNGTVHQAAQGMKVHEGETITSGLHGMAQLRMEDGAFLGIRPNTKMHIDTYAFKEKGRKEGSTISLLKGTFRAITGKIGKAHPQSDLVKTPVATIGIRGTDHEPAYIPAGQPGAGAYDKVNKGKTFMQTSAGRVDLGPNQVGHAIASNKPPVSLPSMPAFYKTPDKPAVKQQKKENKKSGGSSTNSGNKGQNGSKSASNKGKNQSSNSGSDQGSSSSNSSGDKSQSSDQKNGSSDKSSSSGGTNTSKSSDSDGSGNTLVASSSHGNTATDATTSNTDNSDTLDTSTSTVTPTPTTTTASTSTTDSSIVQTYSATGSDSSTVDLTTQTTTTPGGTTSNFSTASAITYATPSVGNVGSMSWVGVPSGQTYSNAQARNISSQWGDNLTTSGAGSVTGWSYLYTRNDPLKEVSGTVSGISGTPQPSQAASYATTGITYGSYNAGSVITTLQNNTTNTESLTVNNVSQPFNWISGPGVSPLYLPQAYQGTATFALGSYKAFDETGAAATLTSSSKIVVSFASQMVGVTLKATTNAGGAWSATTATPLQWNNFDVSNQSKPVPLAITYTDSANNVSVGYGNIAGSLTGSGLTGVISSFALGATDPANSSNNLSLTGVAAFANSAGTVSSTINHRWVAFSSYDTRTSNVTNPNFTAGMIGVLANNTTRLTYDAAGTGIVSFTTTLPYYYTSTYKDQNGVTQTGYNNTSIPVQLSYISTVVDEGTDPVTGISWGRWAGSSNGTVTPLVKVSGITIPTITAPAYLHYIAGPTTNQSVQLPTSGTFSYALAGGTSPTDNLGSQPGTLNSASLKADFTNMTVDVGVKATVGSTTLSGSATSLPIQGSFFHAGGVGGAPLSVTCSGTCSSVNDGEIGGTFTGSTGNGAAMVYSLGTHASGQTGTVISGVAAFHR